jgi:hypothetical protein
MRFGLLGEDVSVEPLPAGARTTVAAARGDEKDSGVGVGTVVMLMGMVILGAVGYAVGFERGVTWKRREKRKKSWR